MASVLQWGVGDAENALTEIQRDSLTTSSVGILRSRIGLKREPQQPFSFLVDTPAHLDVLYPVDTNLGVTNFLFPFEDPTNEQSVTGVQTSASTFLIRVGNEEMLIFKVRHINDSRWEIWVGGNRGFRDTAPVAHVIGEDVVFLRSMRTFRRVYDEESYVVHTSRDGLPYQTRDVFPAFNRVNRVSLPPVPTFDSIRQGTSYTNYNQIQNVIGAFNIHLFHRSRRGVGYEIDSGQNMVLDFYSLDTKVHTVTLRDNYIGSLPSNTRGYNEQIYAVSVADMTGWLGTRTVGQVTVRAYAMLGELRSWQTVEFMLNWKASGTCVGWGCNWGNGYAGNGPPGATGYGYNWGEDFGGGT